MPNALYQLAIYLILIILFYKFWFLRNPKRKIPPGDNVVSPADGKIVKIIEYDQENLPEEGGFKIKEDKLGKVLVKTRDISAQGWLIVISMNIHNMHRQKAPLDGEIISIKYSTGKFLNAIRRAHNMRAALENENNEILMKTSIGKIKVVQVAGVVAARIVCFVKPGQSVKKGENLGLIKFGSQVILVIPKNNLELKVKEKNKVKAGSSIIAEIISKEESMFDFGW